MYGPVCIYTWKMIIKFAKQTSYYINVLSFPPYSISIVLNAGAKPLV